MVGLRDGEVATNYTPCGRGDGDSAADETWSAPPSVISRLVQGQERVGGRRALVAAPEGMLMISPLSSAETAAFGVLCAIAVLIESE